MFGRFPDTLRPSTTTATGRGCHTGKAHKQSAVRVDGEASTQTRAPTSFQKFVNSIIVRILGWRTAKAVSRACTLELRNCVLATSPFLRYCSIPFRRLKKYCFFTLPGLAILQLSQARSALKIRNTLFTTEARVVRQTHSVFFYWWAKCRCMRVPSANVLWESCLVSRSLSRGRLHRQTVKPLPPTCVVSSTT